MLVGPKMDISAVEACDVPTPGADDESNSKIAPGPDKEPNSTLIPGADDESNSKITPGPDKESNSEPTPASDDESNSTITPGLDDESISNVTPGPDTASSSIPVTTTIEEEPNYIPKTYRVHRQCCKLFHFTSLLFLFFPFVVSSTSWLPTHFDSPRASPFSKLDISMSDSPPRAFENSNNLTNRLNGTIPTVGTGSSFIPIGTPSNPTGTPSFVGHSREGPKGGVRNLLPEVSRSDVCIPDEASGISFLERELSGTGHNRGSSIKIPHGYRKGKNRGAWLLKQDVPFNIQTKIELEGPLVEEIIQEKKQNDYYLKVFYDGPTPNLKYIEGDSTDDVWCAVHDDAFERFKVVRLYFNLKYDEPIQQLYLKVIF